MCVCVCVFMHCVKGWREREKGGEGEGGVEEGRKGYGEGSRGEGRGWEGKIQQSAMTYSPTKPSAHS